MMLRLLHVSLMIAVLLSLLSPAVAGAARNCDPVDMAIETTPVQLLSNGGMHRHLQLAAAPKRPVDLVLFGDSIVAGWPAYLAATLAPSFVNLGIAGDKAYSALWRLANVDWSGYNPKSVVLLLGTNDLSFVDDACAVATGLERVIAAFRKTWPRAHVYVIDVLPRGRDLEQFEVDRKEIASTLRSTLNRDGEVSFINADTEISCNGKVPCPNYRPDHLHLTPEGYNVLTNAVRSAMHTPNGG